ncbi:MAG: DUF4058 family protein [Chloroflexaceae bacterium]
MPAPFPGMDPYLEGALWTTFQFSFGAELVRQLAPKLRPRYLALPVERLVLAEPGDMEIMSTQSQTGSLSASVQLATVIPQAVPHVSIEIRDVARRQLVTAIEILSPTNKRGEGRAEYLSKRRRILLSRAHLLELDLLRAGQRVPMQQPLPDAPYFVLLSRAERRPMTDVWPITLDQPLPLVPVPLLPEDADMLLDLQAAFTATYDLLGYDLIIDYCRPPAVALAPVDAAWADQQLRTGGFRDDPEA